MGNIRWYKRDPRAALTGMMELSLEERGAYNTLLDLIYCHDGALNDDPKYIAGWLRCDPRVWKRLRLRLLSCGKLYLNGTQLRNEKADREIDEALGRVLHAAQAGLSSQAKRRAGLNKINVLIATTVGTAVELTQNHKERESRGESECVAPPQEAFDRSKGNGQHQTDNSELVAIIRQKGWLP